MKFSYLLLIALALSVPTVAEDPFAPDEPAAVDPQRTAECACENCDCDPCECKKKDPLQLGSLGSSWSAKQLAKLDSLETRVAELERSSIDAAEAREIATEVAEEVYQRYSTQLKVGIRSMDGKTRAESLRFDRPDQSQRISLAPGETLVAYEDIATGRWVQVGRPVQIQTIPRASMARPIQSWLTPDAEFRSFSASVQQPREVFVRPVVEQIPMQGGPIRRGVFQGNVFGSCANGNCN